MQFADRVLAESAAAWERHWPVDIDDEHANELARQSEDDFEVRLVQRAAALPIASPTHQALEHVRHVIGLVVLVAIVLAALGGATTARALLGVPRDEPVNVFHLLAAVLLPQTVLLGVWLVTMVWPGGSGSALSLASLGAMIVRAGQWLARRLHPGRAYISAVSGVSHAMLRSSLGRWTFSSVSHGVWLAFNIGCLIMLVFLLSTRRYDFAWETTILSAESYRPLTNVIAALPRLTGFDVPNDVQIDASRWQGQPFDQDQATSQAWSSLMVGALIVYSFGPRLLLLGVSLGQRRWATRSYRLDVESPEFARLRPKLEPEARSLGVVDAAPERDSAGPSSRHSREVLAHQLDDKAAGLPVIVGVELPRPTEQSHWPPALHGVRWNDLGMIDQREDRQRALAELASLSPPPRAIVVVCSLATTPDRGIASLLGSFTAIGHGSPVLVLTGGHQLRSRRTDPTSVGAGDVETRVGDWRLAAESAGIDAQRVVEVDLDHMTASSQTRLATLIGREDISTTPALFERRLEGAFARIVEFAQSEPDPDESAAARLHADIGRVFGRNCSGWRRLLELPSGAEGYSAPQLASNLAASAKRFTQLLPDRLRSSPQWLAAGALAGALGCIAAATLISPVAIGALPMWSGLGAALAAAARFATGSRDSAASDAPHEGPRRLGQVVRSGALFAMLLELQRFDEATITQVLDEAVGHSQEAIEELNSVEDVRRWLDELRHRFDLTVARLQRVSDT